MLYELNWTLFSTFLFYIIVVVVVVVVVAEYGTQCMFALMFSALFNDRKCSMLGALISHYNIVWICVCVALNIFIKMLKRYIHMKEQICTICWLLSSTLSFGCLGCHLRSFSSDNNIKLPFISKCTHKNSQQKNNFHATW